MSGTKSPFRMAQATDRTLLLVAHGSPSDPAPQEAALRALAERVSTKLGDWQVAGATLATEGAFEQAVAHLGHPLVYPFFMSEGWFTGQALAQRSAAAGLRQLAPFGVAPALLGIVATRIERELIARAWAGADTTLLQAAHGSARSAVSADAPLAFAQALQETLRLRAVTTGFVEQAPFLKEAARDLGQALCLTFFALRSGHVEGDLPEAFAAAGFDGPVLPPFIEWDETPDVIARDCLRQLAFSEETA